MSSNPFSGYFEGLQVEATPRTAREWAMLAPEERLGKFFLSSVEDEHLLQAIRELVLSAMDRGISDAEFVSEAWAMMRRLRASCEMPTVEFMPQGMSPEEVQEYQKNVGNIDSIARLQLIFRTQCDMAAGYREFQQAFDPVRLQQYPGWRFVRQPGARIKRKDHVAHEGAVRLKTDIEFWLARNSPDQGGFNNPFPPFGFNSWMLVEEVPREECEALGLLAPGEPVEVPAEYARFGLDVVLANSARASVRALPEDARRRIVQRNEDEGIRISPTDDDPDVFEVTGTVMDDDDFFRELDEIERALEALDDFG